MTQQHPITPPQWQIDAWQARIETMGADVPAILLEVAQWGADQELEACCEWIPKWTPRDDQLRAERRPKPSSLKEQALEQLDGIATVFRMTHGGNLVCDTIRHALEQLPDHEPSGNSR
jgi:hypothetical protein